MKVEGRNKLTSGLAKFVGIKIRVLQFNPIMATLASSPRNVKHNCHPKYQE